MEEERDRLAVQVDERVAGLAAADHPRSASERAGAGGAREVLDDLEGSPLGARHPLALFVADGGPGDLGALALSFDGRLERAGVERLQAIVHRDLRPGWDGL